MTRRIAHFFKRLRCLFRGHAWVADYYGDPEVAAVYFNWCRRCGEREN